jgi:hypothetical protein
MVENLQEELERSNQKMRMKKLEYELAKTRVKSSYGKKSLEKLNNLWDYNPGMFDHLK